jgi:tetratricopeptide (TPR) repeat protein
MRDFIQNATAAVQPLFLQLTASAAFLFVGAACTTTPVEKPVDDGKLKTNEPELPPGFECRDTSDCQTKHGPAWVCDNSKCIDLESKSAGYAESEAVYVEGVKRDAQDEFRKGVQASLSVPPDYSAALASFEKAIEIDSSFLEPYFNIGTVFEKQGLADKALEAYQRAIKANPESADAKAFVGKIYLAKAKNLIETGKVAESEQLLGKAKATFDEVIAQDFENVPANNGLALYWLVKGQADRAEEHVKQVLITDPENVTALNSRGLVFLQAGQLNFAEWIFKQKVLSLDPNSVEAHTNVGTVYVRTNNLPLAVKHFTTAIKLDPANVAAHLNLGKIYLEFLNYEGAKERFDSVLKLEANNVEAIVGLGTCLLGMNKFDESIASYEKAIKLDGRRVNLYEEIAKLYQKKGTKDDYKKAIEFYNRHVKEGNLPPTHPSAMTAKALQDAIDQGLLDPQTEMKMPEEGAPEGGTPPEGDAPKAPEGEAPKAPDAAPAEKAPEAAPAPAPAPEPAVEPAPAGGGQV